MPTSVPAVTFPRPAPDRCPWVAPPLPWAPTRQSWSGAATVTAAGAVRASGGPPRGPPRRAPVVGAAPSSAAAESACAFGLGPRRIYPPPPPPTAGTVVPLPRRGARGARPPPEVLPPPVRSGAFAPRRRLQCAPGYATRHSAAPLLGAIGAVVTRTSHLGRQRGRPVVSPPAPLPRSDCPSSPRRRLCTLALCYPPPTTLVIPCCSRFPPAWAPPFPSPLVFLFFFYCAMAFTSPPPLVRYGATPGAVASAWVGAATALRPARVVGENRCMCMLSGSSPWAVCKPGVSDQGSCCVWARRERHVSVAVGRG